VVLRDALFLLEISEGATEQVVQILLELYVAAGVVEAAVRGMAAVLGVNASVVL